ncbi:MAG: hypothetical protein ACP5NC_02640 [Nitrososphaeria archaeon]
MKTVAVRYKNGEWYAIITVEIKEPKTITSKEIKSPVSIDSGLTAMCLNAFLVSSPYAYTGTMSEILKYIIFAKGLMAIRMAFGNP